MDTVALRLLAELPDDAAAALAVVLSVEGSSYRRPGALRVWTVAGDRAAGAVSGGCLEDDLAERVRRGLTTAGRGELVRYNLRGDGEDIWGLSAGCNGLLEVWLQPIPARAPSAYRSAARWWAQGHAVAVTTLLSGGEQWAIAEGAPSLRFGEPREPLPGERAFIDRRRPPPLLVVFGRGPDAVPVLDLARRVGFRTRQLGRGDDLAAALAEEVPFATVVMSHHFPSDREALHLFLASGAAYVGARARRGCCPRLGLPRCTRPWGWTSARRVRKRSPSRWWRRDWRSCAARRAVPCATDQARSASVGVTVCRRRLGGVHRRTMAEARPKVGAMVLAAGRALRMGRPKVLLPWGGRPLLAHVLSALAAAGVGPIVVVTGPDTPPLDGLGDGVRWDAVFNPLARSGMATSVAAGARALDGRVDAALVCLGDQPGIDPVAVRVLAGHAGRQGPAVPVYRGTRGHPVLFPATLFPELRQLTGDQGARPVLVRHPPIAVHLDLPLPPDVDTAEDYARLAAAGGEPGR